MAFAKQQWWKADKNEVHRKLIDHVQAVEQDQFPLFQRFVRLSALYDPNNAVLANGERIDDGGYITENLIATNVDTVSSIISAIDIRAREITDGGDWDEQRQARQREFYIEGIEKLHDVPSKAESVFKEGPGIRGTGLMYVGEDRFCGGKKRKMTIEPVLADDIIVDERECRTGGRPTQMHRRRIVDRDDLIARYPKHEAEIERAQRNASGSRNMWAGYRPLEETDIVVIHSHRAPRGEKGDAGYMAGREVICIDGADLFDEDWDECEFPYAEIRWSVRGNGWYGISLAERIMGHQQVSNKANWQTDMLIFRNAIPTTYVSYADHGKLTMSEQTPGMIVALKGNIPTTPTPPPIHPAVTDRADKAKASAAEESGVNRMLSQGVKPAGLDSGAALRELNNATTQRFATQEKAYERFRRDIALLILSCCKRLGKDAPAIMKSTRFGVKRIDWAKVDPKITKVRLQMSSGLPRTVAGRTQMVLEWAQAGLIDQDESRRLLKYPDIERSLSLFTSGVEMLEHAFEAIAEGEIVMPEPFMPLQACVKRGNMQYADWWKVPGVPEEVLEALRQFIVQAAAMANPEQPAMPGAMPANENMPMDAGAMPPMDVAGGPPQAALAAQAMNLRAV